ncbi:unnamed protein product [Oppiella nova]|uniref:Uncharacterized protein n=1 Tax=Oppiella nova TaxID=334625 RepID=A0A7R9LLC9_9ACAR|nr:unnamed protein product [Oppiella nova]CAG2164791.1 unnamed protein product [Oppiella nova]
MNSFDTKALVLLITGSSNYMPVLYLLKSQTTIKCENKIRTLKIFAGNLIPTRDIHKTNHLWNEYKKCWDFLSAKHRLLDFKHIIIDYVFESQRRARVRGEREDWE